jgi:hypothetical protein
MTETSDDAQATSPRRPPAAPTRWATVTPLGARRTGTRAGAEAHPHAVDGSLALAPGTAQQPARGVPDVPELRLVAGGERGSDDVQAWAARFAQAVVEVLGGDRPLAQLLRWTSQRVYVEIERRLSILNRTTDAGRRMRTVRPQVRSVHVFHPTPTAAEVSVHVRHGQRSRAIAARLEQRNGRWQCTALQLG